MATIVLATFGSLGDLHPKIALGLELKRRGHKVRFAAMDLYRDKIEQVGFEFRPMRPFLDINDRDLTRQLVDLKKGPERLLRGVIFPSLLETYADLTAAVDGADLLINGEVVYVAKSVAEKTGMKWISTSLAPLSMFSSYDPNVYPTAGWYEYLHFLPAAFHDAIFAVMKRSIAHWFEPFQRFREEIGLDPDDDPVFKGKNSPLAHLAMFSRVLGSPQPDWPASAIQTGFCFYDARPDGLEVPAGLREFLNDGEPPIVFTLGSAAVLDAGDFFEQSARAATRLGRRAILIHSEHNERPDGIGPDIAAFDYVPYSMVFPRAACVVHQGGVGTTAQVLRAGVPHLIMPYGHDQPDNAARCRRIGVAEVINRSDYDASAAAEALARILSNSAYAENAKAAMKTIELEHGTETAGDAVERVLNNLTA